MNNHQVEAYSSSPLLLESNRVWRTYTGGAMIEAWQGKAGARDHDFPEEWVASTVQARNPGREHIVEGLSRIVVGRGETLELPALIASNPVLFLGQRHAEKYKDNPAVLVKVIDSAERLTIQVHPDPEFARREFNSAFGKTEAWYILGGRTIDGEEPFLFVGFKPGMTREKWKRLFEEQNIPDMLDSLHRVPVRSGDVYLVEGGLPHAIGSGCFLIEVQEPTDYTLRTERMTPRGRRIHDVGCHQGLGFEKMLDAFHYESGSYADMLKACRIEPVIVRETEGGTELQLIGPDHTKRFAMRILTVQTAYRFMKEDTFCIAIVISGRGTIIWRAKQVAGTGTSRFTESGGKCVGESAMECVGESATECERQSVIECAELKASQQWFFPAGLQEITFEAEPTADSPDLPLQIVLCYPPNAS